MGPTLAAILEAQLVTDGLGTELRKIVATLTGGDTANLDNQALLKWLRENKTDYAVALAARFHDDPTLTQPRAYSLSNRHHAFAEIDVVDNSLEISCRELTDIQRCAVEWDDGALLVLAGPGSGKTRVLTCRIAHLLESSRDERFRILALTFTNKAAHEMAHRVTALAPGLEGRANIGTFHRFCANVLRQHGVHLGIKPNFAIYSRLADRQAVLEDALGRESQRFTRDVRWLLPLIDDLKAHMVTPEQAEQSDTVWNGAHPHDKDRVVHAYHLYEEELRRANALDFNSLIIEACRLFDYPAMVRHYQTLYRYWLIDEFQDTNGAQYTLLRRMAGECFREIFAVADDDQTIYEWNGANVRRIGDLVRDFHCDVVQLPTNFRCPPRIVEAANRLVVYNARRAVSKQPTQPSQERPIANQEQIRVLVFATDRDEMAGIADDIACLNAAARAPDGSPRPQSGPAEIHA